MRPLITLTTDFGDGSYVAQVRGVILSLLPEVRLEDLCHRVAPGDVREAAYLLEVCVPAYPEMSVHVAVVDPGVGTGRKALAVAWAGRVLLGPDNGVLSAFLDRPDEIRVLENEDLFLPDVSPTFHGRDVFAPVAARIAGGLPFNEVGPVLSGAPVVLDDLETLGDRGVVLHVDRFGNLVTSFPAETLLTRPETMLEGPGATVSARARTFGEAASGEPFLYAGSGGRLEVAVPSASAAELLGWTRGTPLTFAGGEA